MRNLNRLATGAPRAIAKHAQRNAVAYVALFVALAGSSYAAVSISGSQIRNHTINPVKFNPRFINGNVRAWALVRANGQVIASAGRPRVALAAALPSEYRIFWGVKVGHCATVASIDGADSRPTEPVTGPGNSTLELGFRLRGCLTAPRESPDHPRGHLQPGGSADADGVQRGRDLLT